MKKTYQDRLKELNNSSIWIFTKQDTNFDEAFKAAKLFHEIIDIENTNVEEYFAENHKRYDINTNRHRVLVISQLYGLITKTPFFTRGTQYKFEKTTDIFRELNKYEIGSKEYNTIKTEQLLKLKIHAIIDTADNNHDYKILPVVFIFQVLKILKDKYRIEELDKDLLFTYVMTAANYSDLDDVVNYIVSGGKPYPNVKIYYDLSRVLTSIENNLNLFKITSKTIAINQMYEDYFYDNFIRAYDIDELHESLHSNIDYSQLLFFHQDFNINLIDQIDDYEKTEVVKTKILSKPLPSTDGDDEREYIEIVDSIKEENINDKVAVDAHKIVPVAIIRGSVGRKFKINPILGKVAIKKSGYRCESDNNHVTFISKRTGKQFMEGHHLIPVGHQIETWNNYNVNVDCVENIISLCPNCHRAIHYGDKDTKDSIIEKLHSMRIKTFKEIGLNITLDELKKMYGIKK